MFAFRVRICSAKPVQNSDCLCAPFPAETASTLAEDSAAHARVVVQPDKTLRDFHHDRDIVKLWKVSGSRYLAGRQELAEVQGPDYSLYDDFPEELNEVGCGLK